MVVKVMVDIMFYGAQGHGGHYALRSITFKFSQRQVFSFSTVSTRVLIKRPVHLPTTPNGVSHAENLMQFSKECSIWIDPPSRKTIKSLSDLRYRVSGTPCCLWPINGAVNNNYQYKVIMTVTAWSSLKRLLSLVVLHSMHAMVNWHTEK